MGKGALEEIMAESDQFEDLIGTVRCNERLVVFPYDVVWAIESGGTNLICYLSLAYLRLKALIEANLALTPINYLLGYDCSKF